MSSVNRAGSVSEISPRQSFLCEHFDVFIGEAGLDRDFGNQVKFFLYEHSSSVTETKLFSYRQHKGHNFGVVCISTLGVCELVLLVKLQESTKL